MGKNASGAGFDFRANGKLIVAAILVAAVLIGAYMGGYIKLPAAAQGQEAALQPSNEVVAGKYVNISLQYGPGNITRVKSKLEQVIEQRLAMANRTQTRPDYLPAIAYSNLPPFPKDFYPIRVLTQYGVLDDLDSLGEEYWKQPEFYPGFEGQGVQMMANPPIDRWSASGFRSYPADIQAEVSPGSSFTRVIFLSTSWLVETYQGMELYAYYPSETSSPYPDLNGSYSIAQDPEAAARYFRTEVDPSLVLLEPAFPIFSSEWVKKIRVKVSVSPDTPSGTYAIGINARPPPGDIARQWVRKYLTYYTSGGTATGVGRPYYQIIVTVR